MATSTSDTSQLIPTQVNNVKRKAISENSCTDPDVSRRLGLPDIKTKAHYYGMP